MPSIEKRTNPSRPDLGAINRYYMHRHSVVDREMRMWIEKKVIVALDARYGLELPADFRSQMLAQVVKPVEDLHGQEAMREEVVQAQGTAQRLDAGGGLRERGGGHRGEARHAVRDDCGGEVARAGEAGGRRVDGPGTRGGVQESVGEECVDRSPSGDG